MKDVPDIERLTELRKQGILAIIGTTHPDGPCLVCEEPLSRAGEGEPNPLLFCAWMENVDDDDSWRLDGVHARCVPKIEVGT